MSQRQVNRQGVRPSYARRRTEPVRSFQPRIGKTWLRAVGLGVIALALVTAVLHATTLQRIDVTGTRSLSVDHVRRLTQTNLAQQWFGHDLLLVNTAAVSQALEQADPGIKQAAVSRRLPHTLVVHIAERQPSLNWKTGGATYLLDADATVIGPTQGSYARLPVVTDTNNLPVKVGDRVAPSSFVGFCTQLAAQLPAAGYQIKEMSVPASTSEVYATTTSNLVLKFDTTRPAGEEISDLQAVQAELVRAKKTPTQYIDLRIPHKAYYK